MYDTGGGPEIPKTPRSGCDLGGHRNRQGFHSSGSKDSLFGKILGHRETTRRNRFSCRIEIRRLWYFSSVGFLWPAYAGDTSGRERGGLGSALALQSNGYLVGQAEVVRAFGRLGGLMPEQMVI